MRNVGTFIVIGKVLKSIKYFEFIFCFNSGAAERVDVGSLDVVWALIKLISMMRV